MFKTISSIKFKAIIFVLLFFSYVSFFGQTIVLELVNQGLSTALNAELITHAVTNGEIIKDVNNTKDHLKETLEINYEKTKYDDSFFTGNKTYSTVSNSLLNSAVAAFIPSSNVPYYPTNKRNYFNSINDLEILAYGALASIAIDHQNMTHVDKQEFYQLRRKILSSIAKETHKSRRLLYPTAAYYVIEGSSDLINGLNSFDF